jgi:hypothetical protein
MATRADLDVVEKKKNPLPLPEIDPGRPVRSLSMTIWV